MSNLSTFTSRPARISCNAQEFYDFITDARNFDQFISADTFSSIRADENSVSFHVNMLGQVSLSITEKVMYRKVVYRGENQQVKDFLLVIDIKESTPGSCEAAITLSAELNPMLSMLAAAPVKRFLDAVADGMESFKGWNETGSQNQSL